MRTGLVATLSLGCLVALAGTEARGEELYGTLKKIRDAGAIAIGYRDASYPFSYLDDKGEPVGYTLDLCRRIVDAVEDELGGDEIAVQMIPTNPESRIPLLVDGTIDIECGSTTNSLSRQEEVDFGHTTFITGTKLLVKSGSGIREVEDLDGRSIALPGNTTNERAIQEIVGVKGINLRVLSVEDHAAGFEALQADRVDAYATDHILLHGLIEQASEPEAYAVVGRFLSFDPYAIMVRRDDSAFRLVVNRTLSRLFRSGEIFRIYQRWFDPLRAPPTDLLEAAFLIQALPE